MLGALRRQSQSIFIKTLLGLLILSFAIWGVGDMVSSAVTDNAAVKVGEIEVSSYRMQREYRVELNRLQRMGMRLDSEQARQLGIMQSVASQLADRLLLTEATRDLGLSIHDQIIRDWIAEAREFKDATGRFDSQLFYQVLAYNNLSEQDFIEVAREDMGRGGLTKVVGAGVAVPDVMLEMLMAYQLEKRRVGLATLTVDPSSTVAEPSEDAVATFHKENSNSYMTPELRELSALVLSVDEIAKTITVTDDKLKQVYDERKEEFVTKATVDMQQMLFAEEEEANKARERVVGGESFADVAKALLDLEPTDISLGKLTPEEIQPSELSEAAFALSVNGISAPVKSPLGWHLVTITAKTERQEQTFEQVRDVLNNQVAREMALDNLYERVNDLENMLAESGASLENTAKTLGLEVKKIPPLDRRGNGADGKAVADLPERANFLQTAFQTDQGTRSSVIDGETSAFVIRVDSVSAAAVKPLEQVHDQVIADWKSQQRNKATQEKAQEILKLASEGGNIETLIKDAGGTFEVIPPITRSGAYESEKGPDLPADTLAKIFLGKKGDIIFGEDQDKFFLARLDDVIKADKPDAVSLDTERGNLAAMMSQDLIGHLLEQLRVQIGVQINQGILEELY